MKKRPFLWFPLTICVWVIQRLICILIHRFWWAFHMGLFHGRLSPEQIKLLLRITLFSWILMWVFNCCNVVNYYYLSNCFMYLYLSKNNCAYFHFYSITVFVTVCKLDTPKFLQFFVLCAIFHQLYLLKLLHEKLLTEN